MASIQLTTTVQPRGPAAAVILDEDAVAPVGEGAKRFPVAATINGYTFRTTVTRMGGEFLLGLNREVRDAARTARSTPAGSRRPDATRRATGASPRR